MHVCTHACMYACTCARVYVCSCLLSLLSLLLLLLLLSSSWWLLLLLLLFLFLFLSRLLCGPAGASSLRPLGQSDEFLRSVTKQRKIDQLESQKSALEGQLARETHGDCVRDCRSKLTCSLASAISLSFLPLSLSLSLSLPASGPIYFTYVFCYVEMSEFHSPTGTCRRAEQIVIGEPRCS